MILQHLLNFEWLNEPEGVFFIDDGMKVVPSFETNFLQNRHDNKNQDNGHLFFQEKDCTNISFRVGWKTISPSLLAQSGVMIRIDEKNWAKCGFVLEKNLKTYISSVVCNHGCSDENLIEIKNQEEIYYKLIKKENIFTLSYSLDDKEYTKIREFSFVVDAQKFKIGAYINNPKLTDFESILSKISIE